jgi:hypothetical protein
MAVDFYIKKDDQLPEIRATLLDADGNAVNLTGASVKFIMADKATGTVKVDAAGVVETPASGIVHYAWAEADTDTAGTFKAEWEVEYGDGRLETFPNSTFLEIKITEDLGGVR